MKRKITDMVNEAYIKELLALEDEPIDTENIKKSVKYKLQQERNSTQEIVYRKAGVSTDKSILYLHKAKSKKASLKILRSMAVAVAMVVLLTTVVYAATAIYNMTRGKVDYFISSGADTPVSGPSYHEMLADDVAKYNAAVGMSVTDAGKTVTLDTIAVDDNFINAFFTIAYDEEIDLSAVGGDYPAYSKLKDLMPWFTVKVDGKELADGFSKTDDYDPYMVDRHTVKMMVRRMIDTMVPNKVDIVLEGKDKTAESGGEYVFAFTVDKTASAVKTRMAQPYKYTLHTADGDKKLDIAKLAVTPFGGVFSVRGHWTADKDNPSPDYLMPTQFYITDDKGNEVRTFSSNGVGAGDKYYPIEMIGAATDAQSLTVVPINAVENSAEEWRSYSVHDIGAKIEINSKGGYILENYVVEGSRVSLVLRPYGVNNYNHGSILINDDQVTATAEGQFGLQNVQVNRKTGVMTINMDYYGATPEELAAISTFEVNYGGEIELDTGAALTLPLSANS